MLNVLLNAMSFVMIICIGYTLRRLKFLPESSSAVLKKILINLTLPSAIIVNFAKNSLSSGSIMLLLAAIGLAANIIMIILAMILTRRSSTQRQALYMLCMPSMNIGAFCIPFVQSFLPALGTVTACMFDVGNSIACTGGTYAFTSQYVSAKAHTAKSTNLLGGFNTKDFIHRLLTSTPLMTYCFMFTLTVCGLHLPHSLITLISPISQANIFIAMLMIGTMIRIDFRREYIYDILTIVGLRHIFSIILAAFCYFVLPWELVIRQALVVVAFAPLSVIAPAYTGLCGGDEGKASTINSITLILSIIEITIFLLIMAQ
ncbi:hypothetical protein EJ419_00700 [Alloscardovia theropitheci]|uniref:Transporter n=1 Tax=Alloscardovia theropitheci TaxID=2496842 RepID=A0A4R0QWV3_9BIFI|nr:AEC family transporter [Alloscardovia theropitheci]TCD54947.1 hypothetical protein EJ419_00700 [Alloscardovia theropitheci]